MNIEMKCGGKSDGDFQRLRCVLACVGKDPARAVLRRVQVEKVKGGVAIVATDGARLRKDFFAMRVAPRFYDIRTNTTKAIRLEPCREPLKFPDYKKAIPSCDKRDAYAVSGTGPRFVMWVGAALGCYVDPELMALGAEEEVEVFIQKNKSGLSPLVVRNDRSTLVVMPVRLDADVVEKLKRFQVDRLRRPSRIQGAAHPKKASPQLRPKSKPRSWWLPVPVRRKAA